MKYLIPSILAAVVLYLLGSFVYTSFNPSDWTHDGRFVAVMIYFFCVLAILIAAGAPKNTATQTPEDKTAMRKLVQMAEDLKKKQTP